MATIYEVAELAGVSPMTAARILAGSSRRSKNRDRVLDCAKKLGYVRNQNAANLRTGRSRIIGIMVPFIDNPFYTKFLQEMHNALAARQYQCLIGCSFGESASMQATINLFGTYNVDGLVLDISEGAMTGEIEKQLKQARQRSRPVVITGAQQHDIPHDHLYLDNKRAIAKVIRHLVSRGHRSIGFLGGLADNLNIKNRLEGFSTALEKAGLPAEPAWISQGNPSLDSVAQRAHQLLRAKSRPTAIVCTSDMIAMVAIKAALENGLRIPQDIAITGFDDIAQASLLNPGLTTVRQPLKAMVSDIVTLLLRHLEAESDIPTLQKQQYEAELVIREST